MKTMKTVEPKKDRSTLRGTAPKLGRGHSFGSAGAGRSTLFIARKSRAADKLKLQRGEY